MGTPGDDLTRPSIGKGRGGCEALKPQFSQDTMAAEEAVAEYLIKQMKWDAMLPLRNVEIFCFVWKLWLSTENVLMSGLKHSGEVGVLYRK